MTWSKPQYSKRRVDLAGKTLVDQEAKWENVQVAREILSDWRAAHSFPLNTFQMTLRNKARDVYGHATIAQRLKRTPSIVRKLRRYPSMKLSRMQDIGGCRAVLSSIAHVRRLQQTYRRSRINHVLVGEKDYISKPKESGYRSLHLVYRYRSKRNDTFNGLQVELQFRSRLQHAWATAVEIAGAFLNEALKSSEGPTQWLRFFALTSCAFALIEGSPVVPGTSGKRSQLIDEIAGLVDELDVRNKLAAYQTAIRIPSLSGSRSAQHYLLKLLPQEGKLEYWAYGPGELADAVRSYAEQEAALDPTTGDEVVLVAAESLRALKRAYPNYFADSKIFLGLLQELLE